MLSHTFCVYVITYLSFHDGSYLNVYGNISLGCSYHCHCIVNITGHNYVST